MNLILATIISLSIGAIIIFSYWNWLIKDTKEGKAE